MNYSALASQIKSMSKDDIVQGMQSGSIPGWMGLARLQEMKSMGAAATQAPPPTSIAHERAIGMAGGGPVPYRGDTGDSYIPKFMSGLLDFNFDYWNSPVHKYAMGLDRQIRDAFGGADSWTPEGPMYDPAQYDNAPMPSSGPAWERTGRGNAPSVVPPMPAPPAPPSGIDALKEQLAAIDAAPSSVPGSPLQMMDISAIADMLPGQVDTSAQFAERRANAADQKDMAKWMGLLQFGAGLSGPGTWSENMAEAGTGLNQVYGERMAAYNQALQDIAKDEVQAQFGNADLMSRNANSSIALANAQINQQNAIANDDLNRMQLDLRNRESQRRDAYEMAKLEELAARRMSAEKIAMIRSGGSTGMRPKDLAAEARQLASEFVDENAVYETDEERSVAFTKAYSRAYNILVNMYGMGGEDNAIDLGDDY